MAKACADARVLDKHSCTLVVVAFGVDFWRRMHCVTDGEIRDRLMVNSKPVTGAYWFAPSEESLIALLRAA